MDSDHFDHLTRHLVAGTTRRLLFAALATISPATLPFLDPDAEAKKGKGKGKGKKKKKCKPACGECETCVKTACTVKADGSTCSGGACQDGDCCKSPNRICGDTCCPADNLCCLGTCCAAGEGCDLIEGECVAGACGSGQHECADLPGNPTCCPNTQTCCQNGECCGNGFECCHETGTSNYYCSNFGCVL